MLIICAGMLRSGSTVQRQVISALVDRFHLGETIAPVNKQQLVENYVDWAESKRWYVYKIHEYVAMPDARPENIKVFTTVRDLYDMTVSLMHFLGMDFETTIHSHEWTSNIPNFLAWSNWYYNLTITQYRHLLYQLPYEVGSIGMKLGLHLTMDECDIIAQQCSLAANRQRIASSKPYPDPEYMAARQIYHGGEYYAQELTAYQQQQLRPLAIWWAQHVGLKT